MIVHGYIRVNGTGFLPRALRFIITRGRLLNPVRLVDLITFHNHVARKYGDKGFWSGVRWIYHAWADPFFGEGGG